jgi:hypothetical protein
MELKIHEPAARDHRHQRDKLDELFGLAPISHQ